MKLRSKVEWSSRFVAWTDTVNVRAGEVVRIAVALRRNTITVTNQTSATVSNTILVNTLDYRLCAGLVGVIPSQGSCAPPVDCRIECELGELSGNGDAEVRVSFANVPLPFPLYATATP